MSEDFNPDDYDLGHEDEVNGGVALEITDEDGNIIIEEAVAGIGTSIIRTAIPALVGTIVSVVIAFLASKGWDVNPAVLTTYLTPAVITAYYAAVRWAEVRVNPLFGRLVGKASAPVYVSNPKAGLS